MGDHRTNTLQYGHLGRATYLPDVQIWEFSRKIDREPSLGFYGHVKCAFPAPETPGAWIKIRNSDRLLTNKDEDALLKARPELAPGLGLLRRHEAASRAVNAAVAKFDPQVSNLLAIGNAINLDRRGDGGDSTVPVAVLVCGDSAASIQLVELDDEGIEWPTNSDGLVKVPTLQSREKALWMGTAGPVQQICFAETVDEKSTWLAVRFLQSTIVFHPQRNKLPLSVHYDDMDFMRTNLEDTHLDANPVLEIPISCTGGIPHADITFNPWYQQQIAVVDRLGNWTVWDIGKQRQSTYWHADRGPSGRLDPKETRHHGERTQRDHYDGWAAISWVGNVHKLLVCDRRNIVLYRIDTDPIQHYAVEVNIQQDSEWILDIKRSQSNLSSVFVLTTTQILWLHVNSDHFPSSSQRGDGQEITVLLSWRHFRDPEDTSLQLAPMLVQNSFSLIISSQLNNMAQVFRFAFSPDDPSIPISVADPFFLPLPTSNSRDPNTLEPSPEDVFFSSLIFQQIVNSGVTDPTNHSKTLTLVKFIGQRSNLEIIEALFVARAGGGDETYEQFSSTPPRVKTQKSSKLVDDDDFIVDDLNELVLPVYAERRNWNGNSRNTREQPICASPYGENWADLYELASAAVNEQIGNRGRSTMSEKRSQTFNHWLKDLTNNFEEFALGDSALSSNSRTMLDILPSPPFLDDIDRNTHDFDRFLTRLEDPMQNMLPIGYEITHLPMSYFPPSNISISDTSSRAMIPTNITKLYDSLVRDWLFPLPGDFPNKIRMAKEKNIRNIVMQLILSRIVLTRRSIPEPHDPGLRLISETAEEDLSSLHPSSSAPWSSQVPLLTQLQNPTITTTSDGQTEPEQSSFFQRSSQTTAAATATTAASVTTTTPYATLRLYTPLKQPDQPRLPRHIADILSHWKLGTNPSAYDWQATVRTLRDEEEQDTESQSASRRRKRREARRLQRRQLQQSQQSYLTSSSATAPATTSATTLVSTSSVPYPSASQVPVVRMWGSQMWGSQQQHQQQQQSSRGMGQGSFLGPGTDRGTAMASQMMVRSSQVTEEADVPMTQVERGVFGSRNASSRRVAKERKKKRAAGF